MPLIADPEVAMGELGRLDEGVAIGSGVARELGLGVGDVITLISPEGLDTPFGATPRINDYEVVYVFGVGRFDIDRTRVYMPFAEAQSFFNREGAADEIEVFVADPARVDDLRAPLAEAAGARAVIWTWRDASGAFLSALDVERRVMFIILQPRGADRRAEHHLGPGDAGEEQGPRHRHPAHDGPDPRLDHAGVLPVRRGHRRRRARCSG